MGMVVNFKLNAPMNTSPDMQEDEDAFAALGCAVYQYNQTRLAHPELPPALYVVKDFESQGWSYDNKDTNIN